MGNLVRGHLLRCFWRGLGTFALLIALCNLATAQDSWPNRPIKLVD